MASRAGGGVKFSKYHALGNDYIVIDPVGLEQELSEPQVRTICDRNYGVGSDGILLGPLVTDECGFGLKILNPDGSTAEKSGNGLRIFVRYLWDRDLVNDNAFQLVTDGGTVSARVLDQGRRITVEMGSVSFDSARIPVEGELREVINESMSIAGEKLTYCAATVGNPHCVVLCDDISAETAKRLGPLIENEPQFPNRTNVQFMQVMDRNNIRIEIWERGAGYTLASGTSSSAAASVARRLGLCDENIVVHMPGGTLEVTVSDNYAVTMTGPVAGICEGMLSQELLGS